ncbi:MAG TPA: calcium-binding protein, partial [Ramlibacter sp.]
DDTYRVDHSGDILLEAATAGGGVDRVYASRSWTLADNLEQLVLTGTGSAATGNGLANILAGNSANNTLDGMAGADTMSGGSGNDVYRVDNAGDVVRESTDATGGTDRVLSSRGWVLADGVEQLYLEGTANVSAVGNALGNALRGNSGSNVLDGRAGADTMRGGDGDDTYRVDHVGDDIGESSLPGGGVDRVVSTISWDLASGFEDLTLAGSADFIFGLGTSLNNTLVGNGGINGLSGRAGNDTLDGGGGRDGLLGNSGADVFRFSSVADSTGAAFDGIGDFVRGTDRIDLSRLDANAGLAGRQDFSFIGSSAFGANATGQLRYARVSQQVIDAAEQLLNQAGVTIDLTTTSAVMLFGSTDADAQAEFAVAIVGTTALSAADLLL